MGAHLTGDDLRRLGSAAEALLSPLAGPSPDLWWRGAERRLRELFPGANVALSVPDGPTLRHESETVDETARQRLRELTSADPRTGLHVTKDPTVAAWHAYRRAHRVEVWTLEENFRALASLGLDGARGLFYNEGLVAAGLGGCVGISTGLPGFGELFVTIGYPPRRRGRSGDAAATVLGLLLPAFRAGQHALMTFAPRQRALAAALDDASEPAGAALLVAGPDGRELHRTAALRRLLAREPERERVLAVMTAMAAELRALHRVGAAAAACPPAASRPVATPIGRYAVHAAFAPALVWGADGAVQVSVAPASAEDAAPDPPGAPRAPRAPRAPGAHAALTPREAEVADLLARRATNEEVAGALGVSWHTARRHTERVLQKLGVSSRRDVGAAMADAG